MRRVDFIGRKTKLPQNQILDIQAQERQLFTRRNALVPLCNLPTEVLLDILDLLSPRTQTNHGDKLWRRCRRGRVGWVGVMGTCTRMRSLVLNTPRLWADVDLNRNVEWTRLCLERSISSHLQVSFDEEDVLDWSEYEDEPPSIPEDQVLHLGHFFETSFPRASVINLNIELTDQLFHTACDVLRAPSLPYLRSLTYTTNLDFHIDQFQSDNVVPVLRGATALSHLVLTTIQFLSPELSLPSLVHFELETSAGAYSQVDFFNFLRHSPLLEHLCINLRYPRRSLSQPADVVPIHLPRLLTLDLTMDVSYLMSHLNALPAPKDKLCVYVEGVLYTLNHTAHDATALLKEVFIYLWDMLDVTQKTVPVVEITDTHAQKHPSLEFTHPGTRIHTVAFNCAGSLSVLRPVLDSVRSIRVIGLCWPGLCDWAAEDPLHNLASAESVEVSHMCDERVQASLRAWLLARTGVNRRIRVLDLRGCGQPRRPECVSGETEKEGLQRMAPELRDAGLAETVLVEGRASA